jgi:N-acetylmuramoyl-L-alanine amidase
MIYEKVVISSGHCTKVQGAVGLINEVEEARRVVDALAIALRERGVEVDTYHDTVSESQGENLERIVDYHNSRSRQIDLSVHFNAYVETTKPMGVECLYYSDSSLSSKLSAAIADVGLINRGAKQRKDLYFLANTSEEAALLEVAFVDSSADVELYKKWFDVIIENLADAIGGDSVDGEEGFPQPPATDVVTGKVSWFGGPDDDGVDADEPLAFIDEINEENQYLFLPVQPEGTTGLARRLNPYTRFIAMRWDYEKYPKSELVNMRALVRNPETGFALVATPSDWGPNEATGRIADLSYSLMTDLELETDQEAEIIFPYDENADV